MKLSFKKGMTLQQYMNEMKAQQNQITQLQSQQINNNSYIPNSDNLYISCRLTQHQRQPSNKLIPFNIPEMDEDNYESSVDNFPQTPIQGKLYNLQYTEYEQKQQEKYTEQDQQYNYGSREIRQTPKFCQNEENNISNSNNTMRKSDIQMKISTMYIQKKNQKQQQKKQKSHSKQYKQYRIKHQSNSPFKKQSRQLQLTPTKNIFSKTLYGNTFLNNLSSINTASSTLYQSKLMNINQSSKLTQKSIQYIKGTIHSRQSKNQKYFQNKNKKQLESLVSYQNMIRNKYQQKISVNGMRVEGVKDKLYDRKNKVAM